MEEVFIKTFVSVDVDVGVKFFLVNCVETTLSSITIVNGKIKVGFMKLWIDFHRRLCFMEVYP